MQPEPRAGDVLEAIDRRLITARRDAETLAERFRRARDELNAVGQKQLAAFTRLARLRMTDIASGELLDSLSGVDRRAGEILEIRAAAEASLRERVGAAEAAHDSARRTRAQHEPVVAAAARSARAAAERRDALLAANDAYAAALAAARAARATAKQAEAKAVVAESDCREKTGPYDADPIFAYLWARRFGTHDYAAGPLSRGLDAWVARRSGYESLRRDYWLLREIPRRLAEHARRMREKADASLAAARALEAEAAETAGVEAAQRALAEAEQRLADIDRTIDTHAAALASQLQERERFAAGEDEHATRCAALLADALRRADAYELRKRAVRTSTEEDDRLVDEVEELQRKRARQQDELIRLRRLHQAERERTLGLEEVRRRLEQSGGGRVPAGTAPVVETLLDRFVAGSLSAAELTEGLRRQLLNFDGPLARRPPK